MYFIFGCTKNRIATKLGYCFLLGIILLNTSCNVVDDNLDNLEARPSVILEETSIDGVTIEYPEEVMAGDTVTIVGRLLLDQGAVITFGGVEAELTMTDTTSYTDHSSQQQIPVEIARFMVTEAMGSGFQPLEVSVPGGGRQTCPDIYIGSIPDIEARTDTTLVVEEVFTGNIPGYTERYSTSEIGSSGEDTEFTGHSITDDGTIYLQSPLDVYKISHGVQESILQAGDSITIDGESMHLRRLLGFAANREGTTFYLSVEIEFTDDPEAEYHGAFMLLKTDDPQLSTFTALNKTDYKLNPYGLEVGIRRLTIFEEALYPSLLLSGGGPIDQVGLIAYDLKVDARNRLLISGNGESLSISSRPYIGRIDEGEEEVSVLMVDDQNSGSGGHFIYRSFLGYSSDGLQAWVTHSSRRVIGEPRSDGLSLYDLDLEELLHQVDDELNFSLISYEPNPDYAFTAPSEFFSIHSYSNGTDTWGKFMGIQDNMLLQFPPNNFQHERKSIITVIPESLSKYAYAGLERGGLDIQNQLTGPVKYVDFSSFFVIGMDVDQNILLLKGGTEEEPPSVYRLGKP